MPFPNRTGRTSATEQQDFRPVYSDPSSLNAGSIRIDYLPTQQDNHFRQIQRCAVEPRSASGGLYPGVHYSNILRTELRIPEPYPWEQSGAYAPWTNEFRFNYSQSRAHGFYTLDNFGGAVPPPDSVLLSFVCFSPGLQLFLFWRL